MSATGADLLPLERLTTFLDQHGLGTGAASAVRIGEGSSNLTYLVERGGARLIVRRPPPPPVPPSAHDMVREARFQVALGRQGVRVPRVLATCPDDSVIGAPFYVMDEVSGVVIGDELPDGLEAASGRRAVGEALVDALIELHAVDWRAAGLADIGRPSGYLDRQVGRFTGLWKVNATRDLPEVDELGERLRISMPEESGSSVVHGDYRLGNVMMHTEGRPAVAAILDWEMAAIGDPLADLGYLLATWSERGADEHPLLLTPVTASEGFPTRSELADRYAEGTGRDIARLGWYQALALWKAAVFCEAIYGRYLRGERTDAWAAALDTGVPRLLRVAASYL